MTSFNCFILALFVALMFSGIDIDLAARCLQQLPPLPKTALPPLPQPTIPTVLKPGSLPPLPSILNLPTILSQELVVGGGKRKGIEGMVVEIMGIKRKLGRVTFGAEAMVAALFLAKAVTTEDDELLDRHQCWKTSAKALHSFIGNAANITGGATEIRNILDIYSSYSGQQINFDKSGAFFSKNVITSNVSDVCRILGVNNSSNLEKYLGLSAILNRVHDLFLPNSYEWNQTLIEANFNTEEASSILSISLPRSQLDDKLIWRSKKSGIYTVRSEYQLLLRQSQIDPHRKKMFKAIWNLECPSKVRIMLWKSFLNFIPTKLNLIMDTQELPLRTPFGLSGFSRNKQLHEGKIQGVNEIVYFILSYGHEYGLFSHSINQPFTRAQINWSPPPQEWVKVNVDLWLYKVLGATVLTFGGQSPMQRLHTLGKYLSKAGNRVAHVVAATGRRLGFDHIWIEEVLPEALQMVEDDQRFINHPS
ncbi:hypothetical protein GQ457_16G016220 [Hibiscus cannabinus]